MRNLSKIAIIGFAGNGALVSREVAEKEIALEPKVFDPKPYQIIDIVEVGIADIRALQASELIRPGVEIVVLVNGYDDNQRSELAQKLDAMAEAGELSAHLLPMPVVDVTPIKFEYHARGVIEDIRYKKSYIREHELNKTFYSNVTQRKHRNGKRRY